MKSIQEDIENFDVRVDIDEKIFDIDEGICPICEKKMEKIIENKDILNGTITFHFIKFRCDKCKKEYLDLTQAEKYDFYLVLDRLSRNNKLEFIKHVLEPALES